MFIHPVSDASQMYPRQEMSTSFIHHISSAPFLASTQAPFLRMSSIWGVILSLQSSEISVISAPPFTSTSSVWEGDNHCMGWNTRYPITSEQQLLPSGLLLCCHALLIYWKGHFGSARCSEEQDCDKNILSQLDFILCWMLKSFKANLG